MAEEIGSLVKDFRSNESSKDLDNFTKFMNSWYEARHKQPSQLTPEKNKIISDDATQIEKTFTKQPLPNKTKNSDR